MNSLLPFKLFCQRKKFSIEKYITSLPNSNFKEFSDFLISRSVQPPSIDDFIKVKSSLAELNKEPIKEDLKEDLKEEVQEVKARPQTRRKRRSKKKIDNND